MSFWFTLSFVTTIAAPIKINYTFINDFIKLNVQEHVHVYLWTLAATKKETARLKISNV